MESLISTCSSYRILHIKYMYFLPTHIYSILYSCLHEFSFSFTFTIKNCHGYSLRNILHWIPFPTQYPFYDIGILRTVPTFHDISHTFKSIKSCDCDVIHELPFHFKQFFFFLCDDNKPVLECSIYFHILQVF